jgi:hypothetical protein
MTFFHFPFLFAGFFYHFSQPFLGDHSMKLLINKMVDHRSLLTAWLPRRGVVPIPMILPGAGCSLGCCCSSCGAMSQTKLNGEKNVNSENYSS